METTPCLFTLQKRWETGGLRNPQTSAQLFGMDPGHYNGVGPGGVGKVLSVNALSIALRLSLLRHRQTVLLEKLWHEE